MQTSEWDAKQPEKIIFKFKSGPRFEGDSKSNTVLVARKSRTARSLPMRAVQFCVLPCIFASLAGASYSALPRSVTSV
jgi:hypothetical protein